MKALKGKIIAGLVTGAFLWGNAISLFAQQNSLESMNSLETEPVWEKNTSRPDWLIAPSSYTSKVYRSRSGKDLVLANGLIRRAFRLSPNAATVSLMNLQSGENFLRAVEPEAVLQINGVVYPVGGLEGQPNRAYLKTEWLDKMTAGASSLLFTGYEVVPVRERVGWKRIRRSPSQAVWPPKGIGLRMDYRMPESLSVRSLLANSVPSSELGRHLLLSDNLDGTNTVSWNIHTSQAHARSSFINEGKFGEIYTPQNTCVYAEASLPQGTRIVEAQFDPGTDKSRAYGPGIVMLWKNLTIKLQLSPGGDGYNNILTIAYYNGKKWVRRFEGMGKIDDTKPYVLRIRQDGLTVYLDCRQPGEFWRNLGTLPQASNPGDPVAVRIGKTDASGGSRDDANAGALVRTTVKNFRAYSAVDEALVDKLEKEQKDLQKLRVSVHYEIYDGLPAYAKWVEIHNESSQTITLNRFTSDILAAVEYTSRVEERGTYYPRPNLHVETDYAFGGMDVSTSSKTSVRWLPDKNYVTQVMWAMTTPCLLNVGPEVGPEQDILPGSTFTTCTDFVIPHDSYDRERQTLAQRKLYRTVAPWVTENPLMMHVTRSDSASVCNAINQCAETGFEMVIMSFGSGFNIEDTTAANISKMKAYADYARSKGIEIGGYSLLSSRSASPASDNVVSPPGQKPTHGVMPALASKWGKEYFNKLYNFYKATGQTMFEHDGSYPGDFDMTPRPPLQKGGDDSQWVMWSIISNFYKWCRSQGVFLNIPDYYFLVGGNKVGMGYREVNWSLPRAEQLIHTRQNIFDGTWEKTPSMGWMHVPLTQYHGGGAAATIEPLHEHLDHYRTILVSNLGAGVQAVYRGNRLYDTDSTRQMVSSVVSWYKQHRDILESDIIHLRRPDGQQFDYYLHANPLLEEKGLLMVFNPSDETRTMNIRVPLYYTGIRKKARVQYEEGKTSVVKLNDKFEVFLDVTLPPRGYTYYIFK